MFAAMKEGWDDIEKAIEDTTELLNGESAVRQDISVEVPACSTWARGRGIRTEIHWNRR